MGETHPPFTAVTSRMTPTPTGSTFQNSKEKGKSFVPTILVQAHSALINSYDDHLEQFPDVKAIAEVAVDDCGKAFLEVWKTRPIV